MRWGFVGCVRRLEINNRRYDMRKGAFVGDATHGVDVGAFKTQISSSKGLLEQASHFKLRQFN